MQNQEQPKKKLTKKLKGSKLLPKKIVGKVTPKKAFNFTQAEKKLGVMNT